MSFYKSKIGLNFSIIFFAAVAFLSFEISARLLQDPLIEDSKPAKLATRLKQLNRKTPSIYWE